MSLLRLVGAMLLVEFSEAYHINSSLTATTQQAVAGAPANANKMRVPYNTPLTFDDQLVD